MIRVRPDGFWEAGLLAAAFGAHAVLLAGTAWTLLRPERRLWPPPGRDSWQFRLVWSLFTVGTASFVGLGVLDWNALSFPAGTRLSVGVPLVAGGLGLAFWGIASLGLEQALGLEGELVATGPYRFTRNPQYVGDIAATAGWMVATGSLLVVIAGIPALAWYVLLPRVEEPWLEEELGGAYRRYARETPRFLGWPDGPGGSGPSL